MPQESELELIALTNEIEDTFSTEQDADLKRFIELLTRTLELEKKQNSTELVKQYYDEIVIREMNKEGWEKIITFLEKFPQYKTTYTQVKTIHEPTHILPLMSVYAISGLITPIHGIGTAILISSYNPAASGLVSTMWGICVGAAFGFVNAVSLHLERDPQNLEKMDSVIKITGITMVACGIMTSLVFFSSQYIMPFLVEQKTAGAFSDFMEYFAWSPTAELASMIFPTIIFKRENNYQIQLWSTALYRLSAVGLEYYFSKTQGMGVKGVGLGALVAAWSNTFLLSLWFLYRHSIYSNYMNSSPIAPGYLTPFACVGNLGWGNREIRAALQNFDGPDYVCPSFLYQEWVDLAEILAQITPGKLCKSFRATGGTEAVEMALRIANIYTGKPKFISIENSYHGNSIGSLSISASIYNKQQPGLLFKSYKLKAPLNEKSLEKVEQYLMKGDVAALIMEPIICNLAVEIPTTEFMQRVSELCKQYNCLFISDEVATGFGRTGKLFASEHYQLQPDIMCLAKGMSSGYGPIGVTMTTDEVSKAIVGHSSFYSSYGWHPLSVRAAITNVRYFQQHRIELERRIAAMSQYFQDRLTAMQFKYPADIRIKGLAIGLVFKKSGYASQIATNAFKKGLLITQLEDRNIMLFPALNIDHETAKKGLDILENSLDP